MTERKTLARAAVAVSALAVGVAAARAQTAPAEPNAPAAARWSYATAGTQPGQKFLLGGLDPAAANGYLFQVELISDGAAVNTLKLAKYFATDADKLLYERLGRNNDRYMQEVAKDRQAVAEGRSRWPKYQGHYSLLNPVRAPQATYLPYATRSIAVSVAGGDGVFGPAEIIELDAAPWRPAGRRPATRPADRDRPARSGEQFTFELTLYRSMAPVHGAAVEDVPFLRVTKTYTVFRQDYSLEVRLGVENLSDRQVRFTADQLAATGVPREDPRTDGREAAYGKWRPQDKSVQVFLKPSKEVEAGKGAPPARDYDLPSYKTLDVGTSSEATPTVWIGQINKYFGSMAYLRPAEPGRVDAPDLEANFYVIPAPESPDSRTYVTGLRAGIDRGTGGPLLVVHARGRRELTLDVFAGPKKRDMFTSSSAPYYSPLYKTLAYQDTLALGSCCTWPWLTLAMMWLLQAIAKITFGNYGVAIIVLVILVRAALHPLTKRSQVSMMKMQKFKPEMERIQKKYADDKEALQREMMKFYKKQGPAQILGCLPMFLQMPIWVALWNSLSAAVELRNAAFLPVWITNLAGPDALVSWHTPVTLPIVGAFVGPITSFNLLPILLTVAMYLQTKFTPQAQAATTPEQEKQQKMMRIMMPVMMLLIFYPAPSGLTLYVMTSVFGGVLEQWVIRKHIEKKQAEEAAAVTTVKVPGRGPRDGRPKKPRGPFWMKHG